MPEFHPRGPEFHPPQPWEYLSPATDWTADCRERYMTDVDPAQVAAAVRDVVGTLERQPHTFWCFGEEVERLAGTFNIPHHIARRLLRDAPGAAMPQAGVWCPRAIAGDWQRVKREVFNALSRDRTMTYTEVCTALEPAIDQATVYAALVRLCNGDRWVVGLQDSTDDEMQFVVARPRGDRASYEDIYKPSAPAAAGPSP